MSAAIACTAVSVSGRATGAATASCDGKPATIVGGNGNSTLNGTPGADVINGRGGNDTINGRGGRDRICGSGGNDTINGGGGRDRLFGGGGSDDLIGAGGSDDLIGFTGRDDLKGEGGDDFLDGGAGGEGGLFTIDGGAGNDRLFGRGGEDVLLGGNGNDQLDGGPEEDDCDQNKGTGSVVNCEADLQVDVSGPESANSGQNITFTVTVKNNGPSKVDYDLAIAEDNSNVRCGDYGFLGLHPEPPLAPGATRSSNYVVNCTDEDDPGGQVWMDATVSGPPDPVTGNNADRHTTAIS